MADFIGNITVPAPTKAAEKFPIVSDFGYGVAREPEVAVHQFGTANNKIEQRFLLGPNSRRFTVRRANMSGPERASLVNFWNARRGPYQSFDYDVPGADSTTTETVECTFAEEPLSLSFLNTCLSSVGVDLLEVPSVIPSYTVASVEDRFPGAALESALLAQSQEVIPLVHIVVKQAGYPNNIYLSDRRVILSGQEYLPRLLDWSPITQSMDGAADNVTFGFGNADRVMRDLAADTNLRNAKIYFSIFHVGTGIKLDFWAGTVMRMDGESRNRAQLFCSDFLYELSLDYPNRKIKRACWKVFNDGSNCPYSTVNPGGTETECDKSWGNCETRNMEDYFGGIVMDPQSVTFKDNSSGTWGIGRSTLTSVSTQSESMYGRPLQQVWTRTPFKVDCQMANGREEGDFYASIGIVSEGPIVDFDNSDIKVHRLDGQPAHGPWQNNQWLGLRQSRGHDPVQASDPSLNSQWFSIGAGVPNPTYGPWKAAGVAFAELRRVDEEGRQLSLASDHKMTVTVREGMYGFTWNSPGSRNTDPLDNPVWLTVTAMLRGLNLQNASTAEQEQYFRVNEAISAAAICNTIVPKIIGTGTETQYQFSGVISTARPLRDWLREILWSCLGYYTQINGKLKVGLRFNSSAVEAFTEGNIIYDSLNLSTIQPTFNRITAMWSSPEFDWKPYPVTVEDIDAAMEAGSPSNPKWMEKQLNLVGVFGPSQASRIAMTRLREEQGGITAAERKSARQGSWQTTILGLNVDPGMVVSLTHEDVPNGSGEFRVQSIRLNSDWSIDLNVKTTTDSMYDVTIGPKPDDVQPDPLPSERVEVLLPMQPWFPNAIGPLSTDPLFSQEDLNFIVGQKYEINADGTALMRVLVEGEYPRTVVLPDEPPKITGVTQQTIGGSLVGGSFITIAISAVRSDGESTRVSSVITVPVDPGTNTNQITLDVTWPAGFSNYRAFASEDDDIVSRQYEGVGLPAQVVIQDTDAYRTTGIEQENLARLVPRATEAIHAGITGFQVQGVGLNYVETDRTDLVTNDYAGRALMIVADQSDIAPGGDGVTPYLNFEIVSNDNSRLTLASDPLAAGVTVADVAIIATLATTFSSSAIGDSKLASPWFPGGLIPDAEKGTVVRIISGTGKDQERTVESNTATVYAIKGTWDINPDASSVFVVLRASADYGVEAPWTDEKFENTQRFEIPAANLAGKTWWIDVSMIGRGGRESVRTKNPWRLLYVFGNPGNIAQAGEGGWATIPSADVVTPTLPPLTEQILLDRPTTTINAPTMAATGGAPAPGYQFTIKLKQDVIGSRVVVWDATYVASAAISELPGTVSTFDFVANDAGQYTLRSTPMIGAEA